MGLPRSLTWTEALNNVSDVDHPVILFVSLTDLLELPNKRAYSNATAQYRVGGEGRRNQ